MYSAILIQSKIDVSCSKYRAYQHDIADKSQLKVRMIQAQARCHRIGQTKMVKVYRLITCNTYEREMFDKASLKLGLDRAVLQSTTALKDTSVSTFFKPSQINHHSASQSHYGCLFY